MPVGTRMSAGFATGAVGSDATDLGGSFSIVSPKAPAARTQAIPKSFNLRMVFPLQRTLAPSPLRGRTKRKISAVIAHGQSRSTAAWPNWTVQVCNSYGAYLLCRYWQTWNGTQLSPLGMPVGTRMSAVF